MKKVILLGASGSIGLSSLEILRNNPSELTLVGASCHNSIEVLRKLKHEFPQINTALSNPQLRNSEFSFQGPDAIEQLITNTKCDIVINGISGAAGLKPSVWTLREGRDLALANKETIVMAGPQIIEMADAQGCRLLPVDSEHSALFFLQKHAPIKELILSASGGAFRDKSNEEMADVRLADALKHPTWDMGKKITIDSSTLANKGLEVIEAYFLFGVASENIKVVIHRESMVHSMVRTMDGALYAQISKPNMQLPIQNALFYPDLKKVDSVHIDPWDLKLSFEKPDFQRFPMLSLAYKSLLLGQWATIAYNAANEVAVDFFMQELIGYHDIPRVTEHILSGKGPESFSTIDEILQWDRNVRRQSNLFLEQLSVTD